MEKNYISLAEMAQMCPYDQEYLSLLARQGKLECKKIGKKWYTTAEAVNEYLEEKRPGEKVADCEEKQLQPKKIKFNYSLLFLGAGCLLIVVSLFIYQSVESKISQLETKTAQIEYSPKNAVYPLNLPGYSDFFAPGKLEF